MDFSNVTSIAIPQGNVTKITDASGNVLWQKNTESVIFTVTGDNVEIGTDSSNYQTLDVLADYTTPVLAILDDGTLYIKFYGLQIKYDNYVTISDWVVQKNPNNNGEKITPTEVRIGNYDFTSETNSIFIEAGTYDVEIYVNNFFDYVISSRDTSIRLLFFAVYYPYSYKLFDTTSYKINYTSAVDSDGNMVRIEGWSDAD